RGLASPRIAEQSEDLRRAMARAGLEPARDGRKGVLLMRGEDGHGSSWKVDVLHRDRMLTEIVGIARRLLPAPPAAPRHVVCAHVPTVAYAKQQRALRPVDVFVHFAGGMDHKGTRGHVDDALWRAHLAAALVAEIDLRRFWMAMIRADLPGLPAGNG